MDRKKRVVILTGAGISAESGIQTFRDDNGLWENHRVEDVATPEAYQRDPDFVDKFYNLRRQMLQTDSITPNPAHQALSLLERHDDIELLVITQNIDNLHERAGSENVLHMHGELLKARCPVTGQTTSWSGELGADTLCTCCQFPVRLRPHVVWFGEMPIGLDKIYHELSHCDLFVAIGTSCHVYPAGGFVHEAACHGARTVELNLAPSEMESEFDEKYYGPASEIVPWFVEQLGMEQAG
ncbi:Sir2 family NAD+-dependent deacetylase [Aliagarivorans marinus]|uniref:Sir2 family NAD+-dependent deacetylase n=1 Tax=Aliagarivorans marinus TaxID=561965 RepID=UPI00040E3D2F|nr:Sir2 family NAD+-dependent deacetylase [Aliagarivorans marinus]